MASSSAGAKRIRWLRRGVLLAVGAAVAAAFCLWDSGPTIEANTVVVIDLRDGIASAPVEGVEAAFREKRIDAVELRRVVSAAALDPRVSGLFVRCSRAPAGLGCVQEIRSALGEFRKSGKPVVALAEGPDTLAYLVASAADEIYVDPSAPVFLTGLELSTVFLRRLLDDLGVEFDLVRVGEYKSGYEQLIASEPSSLFRESMNLLADSLFDEVVGVVARSRAISEHRVRKLIDEAPLSAEAARKEGLVDGVAYRSDVDDVLRTRFGEDVRTIGVDAYRQVATATLGARRVAVIHVAGIIVEGEGGTLPLIGPSVGSNEVVDALREAESRHDIAGVLIRIDSPGGLLSASETIWRQVARTARVKSVVASFGDAGASGAYFVACGAHAIVAQPATLTGGVGVFGGKLVISKLLRERGVHVDTYRRGRAAAFLDISEHYGLEERRKLEERADADYKRFVRAVADARSLSFEAVDRVARGRLWTGRQALERGLVDELGGVDTALDRLRELLDMSADEPIELVSVPRATSVWESLDSTRVTELLRGAAVEDGGQLELQLRAWSRVAGLLDGRSSLAMMPVWMRVR